jgi:hypothetical protein
MRKEIAWDDRKGDPALEYLSRLADSDAALFDLRPLRAPLQYEAPVCHDPLLARLRYCTTAATF